MSMYADQLAAFHAWRLYNDNNFCSNCGVCVVCGVWCLWCDRLRLFCRSNR